MAKPVIVTDSCASIPEEMLEPLDIHSVPYYIHRDSDVLRDMVTIKPEAFYAWLATANERMTTASPGPGDYLTMYTDLAEEHGHREIISIHMTSKGSGAFQAAISAREMARDIHPDLRIEVVDTLNVSMCQGWIVIEAARAAQAGATVEKILSVISQMIPVTRMIQTADTLKYLYMGGRIGRAKHLVGTLLNIKPLISMEDGVIVSLGQARSRSRAYRLMVEQVESAVGSMGKIKVAYVHAAALEEVEKLRSLIEARLTIVETIITQLSPALGVHTGPGTAGLCYFPIN